MILRCGPGENRTRASAMRMQHFTTELRARRSAENRTRVLRTRSVRNATIPHSVFQTSVLKTGAPCRTRTYDPTRVKGVLYQLS